MSKRDRFSINTIIGPDTSVYGNIESGGFTRVDGSLRGDLTARGQIVVGEKARIKSNISGTSITIGGVVYGNVLASERLIVLSTGLVLGDIVTRRIQADEGCLIHGKIRVCSTGELWEAAVEEIAGPPPAVRRDNPPDPKAPERDGFETGAPEIPPIEAPGTGSSLFP